MRLAYDRRRAESAREVPSAAARTAGANRAATVPLATATTDRAAITSPVPSVTGAATDIASSVTWRSLITTPSRRIWARIRSSRAGSVIV